MDHSPTPLRQMIKALRAAEGPDRDLDIQIALRMGYRLHEGANSSSESDQKRLWVVPSGETADRVPYYTSSFDHAYNLMRSVAPDLPAACASKDGRGLAQYEGGEAQEAISPPIAMCIAALKHYMERGATE